jgi:WD40 repeat protein
MLHLCRALISAPSPRFAARALSLTAIVSCTAAASLFCCRKSLADPPSKPDSADDRVWLCDLPETDVKVGSGQFGKKGRAGFEDTPIELNGIPSPHGLGAHPDSTVSYELGKKYRSFRAAAAINDSAPFGAQRPIRFQVLADGHQIWKSNGIRRQSDCQPLLLDVTGVDRLNLKTFYDPDEQGNGNSAHAVWIEPFVSAAAPEAELLKLLAQKRFTQGDEAARFVDKIKALMADDKFARLDALAKEARANHELLRNRPRLEWFYNTINRPASGREPDYLQHLAWLDRWHQQLPDSPTPRIAAANCWIRLAFLARGGGYSQNVTEEGWRAFRERVEKAAGTLSEAEKMEIKDPELYHMMVRVGQYQDWPREKLDNVIDKSLKLDPLYFPTYESMVENLLPRWHGEAGDVRKFATGVEKQIGGENGELAMAAMVLSYAGWESWGGVAKEFKPEQVNRALLARINNGCYDKDLIQRTCITACQHGDFESARRLFQLIPPGDAVDDIFFTGRFLECQRRRANDPTAVRGEETKSLYTDAFAPINGMTTSADGKRLFTAAGIYFGIRDMDSGGEQLFNSHMPVQEVVADSDGDRVLVNDWQMGLVSNVSLLDLNGEQVQAVPAKFNLQRGLIYCTAISADGKRLATGGVDKNVFLWKVEDLANPIKISHPSAVAGVAFSPDGKSLASSSVAGGAWLWDAETGKPLGDPLNPETQGPKQALLRFTPDGKRLVVVGAGGEVQIWDLPARKMSRGSASGEPIVSAAVSLDAQCLAIGRRNADIDLIALSTMKTVHTFRGHWEAVTALVFLPDKKSLLSGSWDATVKFWDLSPFFKESPAAETKPAGEATK